MTRRDQESDSVRYELPAQCFELLVVMAYFNFTEKTVVDCLCGLWVILTL